MFSTVIFSLLAFIAGVISTLAFFRILAGGTPEVPAGGEPYCSNGKIYFKVNPKPWQYFTCIKITSLLDEAYGQEHTPGPAGTLYERDSVSPGGATKTLRIECQYAFQFGKDTESTSAPVTTCDSSSSSSSSSSSDSSSSSSDSSSSSSDSSSSSSDSSSSSSDSSSSSSDSSSSSSDSSSSSSDSSSSSSDSSSSSSDSSSSSSDSSSSSSDSSSSSSDSSSSSSEESSSSA